MRALTTSTPRLFEKIGERESPSRRARRKEEAPRPEDPFVNLSERIIALNGAMPVLVAMKQTFRADLVS